MALNNKQLQFLAKRLISKTDAEAAGLAGCAAPTISVWKATDAEFAERYASIFQDGIELAKDIARQHLGSAMLVLVDALAAATERGGADNTARIQAAKALLAVHGVSTDRNTLTGDPEAPIRQVIELIDKTAPKPDAS